MVAVSSAPLVTVAAEPATGMLVRDYQPQVQDRFYSGSSPTKNFIGDPFDYSAAGRQSSDFKWATLVSPSFVISANHFAPSGTVRFYTTDLTGGGFVDRTINGGQRVGTTDLWIGHLSSPVPGNVGVPFVKVMSDDEAALTGAQIFTVGQSANGQGQRVGTNNIDGFATAAITSLGNTVTRLYTFDYDAFNGTNPNEARLVDQDSGGPTFTLRNGELALVGIHLGLTADENDVINGSIDSYVPEYITSINATMTALATQLGAPNEQLTIVPEPVAVGLIVPAMLLVLGRRQRRSL